VNPRRIKHAARPAVCWCGMWQGWAGRGGLSRDGRTISMCSPVGSVSSSMS
jgi:hypothetical protein